jgi:hypothetical protein
VVLLGPVIGRRKAEDLAMDGIREEAGGPIRRRAEDLAKLGTPLTADDDRLPPRMILAGQAGELPEEPHSTISDDVSLCHPGFFAGR